MVLADERQIELFRWGLVPHWADDPGIGNRLINARAETVAQKPAFRDAFKQHRCLVLADSYYEWQAGANGKTPYRFVLDSGEPFAFAGLWAEWKDANGDPLRSFTLITTSPNATTAPVHNRMPVILRPEAEARWLDPATHPAELHELLQPYPDDQMHAYAVSKLINSPSNDSPAVIEPA